MLRRPRRSRHHEASYARVIDGEHLWLAVRGATQLWLRRPGAPDLAVPGTLEGGLVTAVHPIAEALADLDDDVVELTLYAGEREATALPVRLTGISPPSTPSLRTPRTSDGLWQFEVAELNNTVVVRRLRAPAGVPVLSLQADDDGVTIRVASDASRVELRGQEAVIDTWPLVDGSFTLTTVPSVILGIVPTLSIDGVPLVRRSNTMQRPHLAVLLPPMIDPDLELRWLKGGRLALARRDIASPM